MLASFIVYLKRDKKGRLQNAIHHINPSISHRFESYDNTRVSARSCKHLLFRDAILRPSINFYDQYWVLRRHRQMFPIVKKGTPQISCKSATVQPIFGDIRKSAVIYEMRAPLKYNCPNQNYFFL